MCTIRSKVWIEEQNQMLWNVCKLYAHERNNMLCTVNFHEKTIIFSQFVDAKLLNHGNGLQLPTGHIVPL